VKSSWKIHLYSPFGFAAILLGVLAAGNLFFHAAPQYAKLAESLIAGKFYFLSMPTGWGDTSFFEGHYYWPLGVLPAILLIPFVWSGVYHQGALSFMLVLGIFYLCFRLAQKLGYSRDDACWFAIAFCFGTSFIGVATVPVSWSYATVVAVLFLFLAINEFQRARRFLIIGLFVGLAMASRPLTGLNSLFFAGAILCSIARWKQKVISLAQFTVPVGLIALAIAWYNFQRFGNPLETGYMYQIDATGRMVAEVSLPGNNPGPLFSLNNIPQHFIVFAFGLPEKNATGVSVFLVSPFLVFLLASARRWDMTDYMLAVNVCVLMLVTLAFRSTGARQIGYRFTLDYLPFVFWLLMRRRSELSRGFKCLVGLAVIIDLALVVYHASVRFS
jgi:hypothetical protein